MRRLIAILFAVALMYPSLSHAAECQMQNDDGARPIAVVTFSAVSTGYAVLWSDGTTESRLSATWVWPDGWGHDGETTIVEGWLVNGWAYGPSDTVEICIMGASLYGPAFPWPGDCDGPGSTFISLNEGMNVSSSGSLMYLDLIDGSCENDDMLGIEGTLSVDAELEGLALKGVAPLWDDGSASGHMLGKYVDGSGSLVSATGFMFDSWAPWYFGLYEVCVVPYAIYGDQPSWSYDCASGTGFTLLLPELSVGPYSLDFLQ